MFINTNTNNNNNNNNNHKWKEKPFKSELLPTSLIYSDISQPSPTSELVISSSIWLTQEQEGQKSLNATPTCSQTTISPEMSVPRMPSTPRKADPISLKNSLDEILGINKGKYWSSIQSFI